MVSRGSSEWEKQWRGGKAVVSGECERQWRVERGEGGRQWSDALGQWTSVVVSGAQWDFYQSSEWIMSAIVLVHSICESRELSTRVVQMQRLNAVLSIGKKAGAKEISIAVIIHSFDRTRRHNVHRTRLSPSSDPISVDPT